MKFRPSAVVWLMIVLAQGCDSGTGQSAKAGKPFLDQTKEVAPHQEWSREVTARKGGTITFHITSQAPFAVTVVTDKGFKALQGNNKKQFDKVDVLLTLDSKGTTHEGQVALPAGSSYFIIENQSDKKVEIHLQCFPPG